MSKRQLRSQWSMLLLAGWFKVPRDARKPQEWRMIYNSHKSDGFVMRYPAHVAGDEKRYVIAALDEHHFGLYQTSSDDFNQEDAQRLQYVTYGQGENLIEDD